MLCLWMFGSPDAHAEDLVAIVRDTPLKVSGRVVGSVKAGEAYRVKEKRGVWLKIENGVQGWIRESSVARDQAAAVFLLQYAEEHPDEPGVWVRLVRLASEHPQSFPDSADDYLDQTLQSDPHDSAALFESARARVLTKEYSRAEEFLDRAVENSRPDAKVFRLRGELRIASGRIAEGISDLEQAIALGISDAELFNEVAWILATDEDGTRRNGKKAIQFAKKAVELSGEVNFGYVDTLAAAYAEDGQFDEAVKWQEKAVKLLGSDYYAEAYDVRERVTTYGLKQPHREKVIYKYELIVKRMETE